MLIEEYARNLKAHKLIEEGEYKGAFTARCDYIGSEIGRRIIIEEYQNIIKAGFEVVVFDPKSIDASKVIQRVKG